MDDDDGPEQRTSVSRNKKLISVAKQFLCCSGAIGAPLAPALIANREETKQFDYNQVLGYRFVRYAPFIFQFVGIVLSVFSLRLLGRKNSLILTNLMHLLPLMMYLSDVDLKYDFAATMIFHVSHRFQIPTMNLYIAEVSDPMLRAVFVGISALVYQVGYYINEVGPSNPKILPSVALFAAVGCVIASVRAIESPYWLALKGKREKAEKAYEWLRGAGTATSDEAQELFEQADADTEQLAKGLVANVFSLRFGIPLLVTGFMYLACSDLADMHMVTYLDFIREVRFYNEIDDKPFLFGQSLYFTLKYTLPIAGALLFCLVCVLVGRRILFIGSVVLNLSLFASYLLTAIPTYIIPFSFFFTYTGAEQIPEILAAEIYPGITRDLGAAASESIYIVFHTIDKVVIAAGKHARFYKISLNFRLTLIPVGLICTYFYMPETKNATLVKTDEIGSEMTFP